MYIIMLGVLAFALFFFHDVEQIRSPNKAVSSYFFVAFLLLAASTILLVLRGIFSTLHPLSHICAGIAVSAIFFIMLIYTLFFALPYNTTYRSINGMRPLIAHGVYALCRHPGILWFAAMYGALFAALGGRELAVAFPLFSALNLFYAAFQDRFIFPRQFAGYDTYRQTVPFLIPTPRSLIRCIRTWPGRRPKV